MKPHSIKTFAVMLLTAMLFAACDEKEIDYSTTHPIVGEWEYLSATCEVVHWGSGTIDTTYDLGSYAPWKDMVFYADDTAKIELQNMAAVWPPQYGLITFRWIPGFEESWASSIELNSDAGFYTWIQIEENSNGILKFYTSGPSDYDAQNQKWYHYTYRRR